LKFSKGILFPSDFSKLLKQEANRKPSGQHTLDDEYYNFDELPSTRQTSSPRSAGAENIKEEGIFSLGDILADLGRKGVEGFKDIAGRGIGFNVGTNAGYMLGGIPVALAGGVFGALKGGNLFDGGGGMAPDLQRSLYGEYGADSIGRLGSGIMAGYNPRAGNLLNRAVQRRQNVLRSMKNIPGYKGLNYDPLTDFINLLATAHL